LKIHEEMWVEVTDRRRDRLGTATQLAAVLWLSRIRTTILAATIRWVPIPTAILSTPQPSPSIALGNQRFRINLTEEEKEQLIAFLNSL
jgi:hypothetical protein